MIFKLRLNFGISLFLRYNNITSHGGTLLASAASVGCYDQPQALTTSLVTWKMLAVQQTLFIKLIIFALLYSDNITLSLRVQPYRVSFILGGPAAGKSTQCKKLVDDYGCIHLSAGDLLREERASGSSTATLIESYINEGTIVPVQITLDLIRKSMENSKAFRFLIDGFPRNEDNFLGWNKVMTKESCLVDSIIFIECPEDECKKRIIERAKTSGRSDDNLETLTKRFVTFNEITLPVIQNFEKASAANVERKGTQYASKGVYKIAGDRDIEAVYRDIKVAYEAMVIAELLQLNRELLTAETNGDTDTYQSLVDTNCTVILNANSSKDLINRSVQSSTSQDRTELKAHVRVMGKSAVMSYTRSLNTGACEETRVWQLDDEGLWKNVHIHRVMLN